jgi:hypothetical protein
MKPIKPTSKQRALFQEHFVARQDGGLNPCIEDHLKQIAIAKRVGLSDRKLAESLGVPVNYVQSLKATMK